MKVGFLAHDFITWGGGVDFLRLVMDSLLAAPRPGQNEFHLLIPDSGSRLQWRAIRSRVKRTLNPFSRRKSGDAGSVLPPDIIRNAFTEFGDRLIIHHIDIGRPALARSVKRLGVEVVLPAVHSPGADFPHPWVAYTYDFQHKYLPGYFSPDDCRSRDEHFSHLLTEARAAIVNSRSAAGDIARFVPEATARIFTLPFAPAPSPEWAEDRPGVLPRYGIEPPYFLISNQFWAHKEHLTAFTAFREVVARHPEASLICTGSTVGARDPEYYPGLVARLKGWKLEEKVRILGLIPKLDQIEIMKQCCAVVQPTLFEGDAGGGSVYDAVSLDVPAIASDIPVNQEVVGGGVTFYPVKNAGALAEAMNTQLSTLHTRKPWNELVALGRSRRAAAGAVLWEAIDFVA
jgi:glycosyltransferase involved in cell wall biosynthesis